MICKEIHSFARGASLDHCKVFFSFKLSKTTSSTKCEETECLRAYLPSHKNSLCVMRQHCTSAKIFFHDTFHLICSFRHKLNHYYTVLNLSLRDHIMLLMTSSPNFQNSGFGEWVTWTNTVIIPPPVRAAYTCVY